MSVYIYALWAWDEDKPRYVGQTDNLTRRFDSHLNSKQEKLKYKWLKEKKGHVVMVVLVTLKTWNFSCENHFIKKYKPPYNHQVNHGGLCDECSKPTGSSQRFCSLACRREHKFSFERKRIAAKMKAIPVTKEKPAYSKALETRYRAEYYNHNYREE